MKRKVNKPILIVLMALCMTFIMSSVAFANEVIKDGNTTEIIADEEHLKVLNELKGKDITYAELLEAVFPEAIEQTPPKVLEIMKKTPYSWEANEASIDSTTEYWCNGFSSIGEDGSAVKFRSYQYAYQYPGLPCAVPYMSVLSSLMYGGDDQVVKSSYKTGQNVSSLTTGWQYYNNASAGYYLTQGTHYAYFPDASGGTAYSYSNFGDWWYYN